MGALRRLEDTPSTQLLGAIAVAGPHNLRTISFPAAMSGQSPNDSLYPAYMTRGYAHAYGVSIDSVVRDGQAANVDRLLDDYHGGDPSRVRGGPRPPASTETEFARPVAKLRAEFGVAPGGMRARRRSNACPLAPAGHLCHSMLRQTLMDISDPSLKSSAHDPNPFSGSRT
jgi:hypothetical protein